MKKLIFFIIISMNLFVFSDNKIKEEVYVYDYISKEISESKNIQIISEKDISKFGINSFSELFDYILGLNINKRSNNSFDINIRGSNFEQVLILINGTAFDNLQTGHFNSNLPFSVYDIKRIEIIKNSSSLGFGSNGYAGAINFILKNNNNKSIQTKLGDKNLNSIYISYSDRINNLNYLISYNRENSRGYYKNQEYDKKTLNLNLNYKNKNHYLSVLTAFYDNDFGAENFYAPFPSIESTSNNFINMNYKYSKENLNLKLNYSYSQSNDNFILNRYNIDFFKNNSRNIKNYFSIKTHYKFKHFKILSGYEFNDYNFISSTMGEHILKSNSIFINTDFISKKFGLNTGLRFDVYNNFPNQFNYNIGGFFNLKKSRINFNIGKTSRIPTFTELYYNSPSNIGNTELLPENSINFETGISIFKELSTINFNLFYRKQKNTIDWIKYDSKDIWSAVNISKNNIAGFDFSSDFFFNNLYIKIGFEKIFVINFNNEFLSKYAFRFSDFTFRMNFTWNIFGDFNIISNYSVKKMYETKEIENLLNFALRYRIKDIIISFHIDNVFNSIIEHLPYLKTPGRWFYFIIRYDF